MAKKTIAQKIDVMAFKMNLNPDTVAHYLAEKVEVNEKCNTYEVKYTFADESFLYCYI